MLDFSWKVFSMTGNVDTYLLLKELERDNDDTQLNDFEDELDKVDAH
ncbi:YqzL family protein [Bacillus sp. FJAT-45350]|nr:YqzL family protein [Bacillus sp. FJAT-45350]